jgi:hypothetical protein
MVGDYFATSFVSRDEHATAVAFPMFMVASPPKTGTACSDLNTGAPGQDCNQPTFTVGNGVAIGGAAEAESPAQTAAEAAATSPSRPLAQFQVPNHVTTTHGLTAN